MILRRFTPFAPHELLRRIDRRKMRRRCYHISENTGQRRSADGHSPADYDIRLPHVIANRRTIIRNSFTMPMPAPPPLVIDDVDSLKPRDDFHSSPQQPCRAAISHCRSCRGLVMLRASRDYDRSARRRLSAPPASRRSAQQTLRFRHAQSFGVDSRRHGRRWPI